MGKQIRKDRIKAGLIGGGVGVVVGGTVAAVIAAMLLR